MKQVLAFDFGASSGRVIIGKYDGSKIHIEELHRFSNDPVMLGDTFHWDVLRLFHEIKQGLTKVKNELAKNNTKIDSIGIDTWGVDYGLLDNKGRLLENPVHYRDKRTHGIKQPDYYNITGIQHMNINTIYQLYSLAQNRPELLERADKLLFMPDLFNYFLTGEKSCEYSIASTSGLLNAVTKDWSAEVLSELKIPQKLFCEITKGGRVLGNISGQIREELSLPEISVVSICGHDTACAVVAVPAAKEDFLYLSCGTWSLMGTELDKPLLDSEGITNEGGYGGKIRYLKNIVGLWLIQESRREWKRQGKDYSFEDFGKMARAAEGGKCYIDTDYPDFSLTGNLPQKIKDYCKNTGQFVPQTDGEVLRCIYDSLAKKYAETKDEIEKLTGKSYDTLHMIGGGIQDEFLCEQTAKYCKCKVLAGPIEATAMGNIAIQLMAFKDIKDIKEAREIIRNSVEIKQPGDMSIGKKKRFNN